MARHSSEFIPVGEGMHLPEQERRTRRNRAAHARREGERQR